MLELILGASGSGKSTRLMEELKARAQAGQHSILLVPEQFTSSTESALYAALEDALSGYVDSYSFTTLAETLLARYGGAAVPTLTDAGRAVLVRRAVDALPDKIVYYGRQRRSAAFCEKAAQTIEELKSAGVTPQMLAGYAAVPGADAAKLSELALIYETYEALLQNTAMDPGDRVELAARRMEADFFAGRRVYIDEFDTFNASKRAMLGAMLSVADVTVALCCDGPEDTAGGMGVFSGAKRVAAALKSLAERAGVPHHTTVLQNDLRHGRSEALAELNLLLTDPGYTPEHRVDPAAPALVYHIADSRQEEAKAVTAAIRKMAQAGTPYRRMAVICRSAEPYLSAVRYEFRLAGIPLFCDEPTTPENTAPARAVRAALEVLRGGITSSSMLKLLKTGLVDLPEEQQYALENYAYTWNLKAADWRAPFTGNPAGYVEVMSAEDTETLALANAAREFLVNRAQRFAEKARGAAVGELTRQLYLFLQKLGAETSLETLAARLRAAEDHPAAEEALREWNTVMALLDEMVRLLEPGTGEAMVLSPADYDDLFGLLLRTTDMGHIPQSLDSVILTTAGRMRLPQTDACFILGLAEGEFPQTPGELGLLSHADRDAMIARGAELPDCFENRVIREQVCFYKALTAARKFVWLSWPGGAAGLPACAALAPVLELLAPPAASLEPAALAGTPAAALDLLGSLWQENTPERAAVYAALQAVENTPQAAPGFAAVRRTAAGTPPAVHNTAALEKLLGRHMEISPSKFETYANCPFGYFMQYVLRAKPRPKAELAPNISGTLTHWVLENALRRTGDAFLTMGEGELTALVETLTAEYTAKNLPGAGVRMQYLLARIRKNLVGLLLFLQADMRQSGFRPVAFELRINTRPDPAAPDAPMVPPVELSDGLGHTIRVVGTIDRVDAMPLNGQTWLRVVDYKTGSKKFDLREVYCGLDCQMLLYLFTLARNGGDLFPGAVAAGVEYLLADPNPATVAHPGAAQPAEEPAEEPAAYPLDGLLVDEESIYRAMDPKGSGRYVPLAFSEKTGKVSARSQAHLADAAKLARIQKHIDGLLAGMAKNLYAGNIAAEPLAAGSRTPCEWCDYRAACRAADGSAVRRPEVPEKPFETDAPAPETTEEKGEMPRG